MAKKGLSPHIKTIKTAQDGGKLLVGSAAVLKALRQGKKLQVIYLAANCPETVSDDLVTYGRLSDIQIVQLEEPNDELGTICKKQYSISALGIQ